HLTATSKDGLEIKNWSEALKRSGVDFPYINSLKGMTGHCLAASGSIECVASVLELKHQFLFPNINLHTVHDEVLEVISESKIPRVKTALKFNYLAKASFGFGDVNCCLIFKTF
ncbi:MAG: beta-ketoacyl-[acyl-carrier-protein] synthase family protein, partial [Bacteroidota bacterium]|nr:beta-ketoacyl-[acyl-carrier-protein] synthase family protein [Bacteroidota bacterium]